jgi:hyperosmotically inducible protein
VITPRTKSWRRGALRLAAIMAAVGILIFGVSGAKAAAPSAGSTAEVDVLGALPPDVSGLSVGPAAPADVQPGASASQDLTDQIRRRLVTLPWVSAFDNLQFEVDGDQVILSGQVMQPYTKSDAEAAVKRIAGVAHVQNDIAVLPVSPMDNEIRRAEYHAIFSQPSLARYAMGALPSIRIVVDDGHVTLEGAVSSEMDRTIANARALSVQDVFSVTNNLRVD